MATGDTSFVTGLRQLFAERDWIDAIENQLQIQNQTNLEALSGIVPN